MKTTQNRVSLKMLFNKNDIFKIVFYFSILIFGSCKFANKETEDNSHKSKAQEVVEKSIDFSGSLEKWQKIRTIEYSKKTRLLVENGSIEKEITQYHEYILKPFKQIKISWTVEKDTFLILQNDSISYKLKNNNIVEKGDKVASIVNSSIYVLGMPFKLLDKGTNLIYEGQEISKKNDTLNIIKASYDTKKYLNHSSDDEWWYYFDKKNGAYLKSKVYHKPTYALIENLSSTREKGMIFPKERKSYRCDKFGNKLFLRGEFWYDNFNITLDE